MAQFDREGGIDSTTIVMLGNSLTENGKDWAERIGTTKNVVNRGIIGDNTVGMKERLYQITPFKPKAIFLMAGINDMVGNTTYEVVAQHVIALIETIRSQAPQTQLFVQSILPINETDGRWKTLAGRTDDIPFANMLIKAYCEKQGYTDVVMQTARKAGATGGTVIRSRMMGAEQFEDNYGIRIDPDGQESFVHSP